MKNRVLIVTLNDYIIYQPSILNLYDSLIGDFEVCIVSFQPEYVTKQKDESRNVVYLKPGYLARLFYTKFDFLVSKFISILSFVKLRISYYHRYYQVYLPKVLRSWLQKRPVSEGDIVIAVDLNSLIVCQKIYGAVHFLSLEVENKESPLYRKVDATKISSIFVQSEARAEYMFPKLKCPRFIVQNAPVFKEEVLWRKEKCDFIFAGTARKIFGIFECIDFVKEYRKYKMVQKGGGERKILNRIKRGYEQLIADGRLVLDSTYATSDQFIGFVSKFKIGFCFYSWEVIEQYYNYRSAPSGKLFVYLAAGVPVIASKIEGFSFVSEYNCGILIDDYSPESIYKATQLIEESYETFSENCLKVARIYSFDKTVEPYLNYLRAFKQFPQTETEK